MARSSRSNALFHDLRCSGESNRKGAQIEVVGAEVFRLLALRAHDLGLTQRRLNHPGNAGRDAVLQIEDVF